MFKKRKNQKKMDLTKDVESILVKQDYQPAIATSELHKSIHSKKISKSKNPLKQQQSNQKQERMVKIQYGLIEKQAEVKQKPKQQNVLMDLYVKRKMQELKSKENNQDATVNEILQMQKQYLVGPQDKIAEYDVKQIKKKLQKMATDMIKEEMVTRNNYLKNLLENQHERTEYASKKELRAIKQDKERIEKELTSKYKDDGRRHYVDNLKFSNIG